MLNRRSFLARTAAVGAGLTLPPTWLMDSLAAPLAKAHLPAAGTGLARFLVLDDLRYLAELVPEASGHVKLVYTRYFDRLRVAHHIDATPAEVIDLLVDYRADWPDAPLPYVNAHWWVDEMREPKLAAVSGVLVHHAMQRHLPAAVSPDAQRTRDATVLRTLHGFEGSVDVNDMANLIEQAYTRTAIRMHTFEPDHEAVDDWILHFVDWYNSIPDQARAFAEAYASATPNPTLINPDEALIQLANHVRRGQPIRRTELRAALDERSQQSAYAQALAAGYDALNLAGQFMAGGCSVEDLKAHFA
ncbi:MAG: hypothetical protein RhofKO_08060 [Rhodothermales bacterium]